MYFDSDINACVDMFRRVFSSSFVPFLLIYSLPFSFLFFSLFFVAFACLNRYAGSFLYTRTHTQKREKKSFSIQFFFVLNIEELLSCVRANFVAKSLHLSRSSSHFFPSGLSIVLVSFFLFQIDRFIVH